MSLLTLLDDVIIKHRIEHGACQCRDSVIPKYGDAFRRWYGVLETSDFFFRQVAQQKLIRSSDVSN